MSSNKGYVVIGSVGGASVFGQSALDTSLWTYFSYGTPSSSASVDNGDLLVAVAGTTSGSTNAGVWSNSAFDLTGNSVVVKLAALGGAAVYGDKTLAALVLETSQENPDLWGTSVVFGVSEGYLYGWYCPGGGGGNRVQVLSTPYDAESMKWLRIRESGGSLYFDAAPDAAAWVTQGSTADPFSLTSLYAALWGNGWGSGIASTAGFSAFSAPGFTPASPAVTVTAVVVGSDSSVIASPGNGLPGVISVPFNYGDSDQAVRDAIASAVRSAAGDSTLDVGFIAG